MCDLRTTSLTPGSESIPRAQDSIRSKLKGAFNFRHWLAHGSYWRPKFAAIHYQGISGLAHQQFLGTFRLMNVTRAPVRESLRATRGPGVLRTLTTPDGALPILQAERPCAAAGSLAAPGRDCPCATLCFGGRDGIMCPRRNPRAMSSSAPAPGAAPPRSGRASSFWPADRGQRGRRPRPAQPPD